jgi:hypothetical protein
LIRPLLFSAKVTPFASPEVPEPPQASEAKNLAQKVEDDFSDLPDLWTETLNQNQYSVRILGEHIYIKSKSMEDTPGVLDSRSFNCDGQQPHAAKWMPSLQLPWVGTCVYRFTILWMFQNLPTPCSLSLKFKILTLSKQRIEGTVQGYDYNGSAAPGTCPTPKDNESQLTLIPQ